MSHDLIYYATYFGLTLFFSTIFAMGGVGSAIALVPIFNMMGAPINLAKATGLFINSASTITASIMNFFRGVLDIKFALPLVISLAFTALIDAYLSKFIPEIYVKYIFVAFLFFAGSMILFGKKEQKLHYNKPWIMVVLGRMIGSFKRTFRNWRGRVY